jgi:hypothetical protein
VQTPDSVSSIETTIGTLQHGPDDELLRQQVAADLSRKLSEYRDPKKGLRIMAQIMGIHEKTLRRLMDCENRAGYQTLLKIYRALFNSNNDAQLLELVPAIVKRHLEKHNPKTFERHVSYTLDIERELNRDPVFTEVYFLAGTGGVTRDYVSFQYGQYGERLLMRMNEEQIVVSVGKGLFELGPNQATLGPETLKKIGLQLVESFLKPDEGDQLGENFHALYAEGLSEEAYNRWIKIDEEAYRQKIEIAKDPNNHGSRKAFTFLATDTLRPIGKPTKH